MPLASTSVIGEALLGLVALVAIVAVVLFGAAGTFHYPEAWAFLALFAGSSLAVTLYLAKHDPALLARRTKGGPFAEPTARQKIIQSLASLVFLSTLVLPALDHRFHDSRAPLALVVLGDVLIALGFWIVWRVFRENTFTSATVEVAKDQRVVDTGPYAVMRHPMYAAGLVLVLGISPALGSLVGLVTWPAFLAVIVWRLLEEERVLVAELPGYAEYRAKIRYRLVPGVW